MTEWEAVQTFVQTENTEIKQLLVVMIATQFVLFVLEKVFLNAYHV